MNASRWQLFFKNIDADIQLEKPRVKAWLRPCGTASGFFIHDMSESVWRIMLFKLFTQRKEMERKLGELHEAETPGWSEVAANERERETDIQGRK